MTFTAINPNAAPTTALVRVRLAIGDTDEKAREHLVLQDEVIQHYIDELGELPAAVKCARLLLARFAREADTGTRGAGLEATRRFERLKSILSDLERLAATSCAAPIGAPYLSLAARQAYADGEDNLQPPFKLGMLDADNL